MDDGSGHDKGTEALEASQQKLLTASTGRAKAESELKTATEALEASRQEHQTTAAALKVALTKLAKAVEQLVTESQFAVKSFSHSTRAHDAAQRLAAAELKTAKDDFAEANATAGRLAAELQSAEVKRTEAEATAERLAAKRQMEFDRLAAELQAAENEHSKAEAKEAATKALLEHMRVQLAQTMHTQNMNLAKFSKIETDRITRHNDVVSTLTSASALAAASHLNVVTELKTATEGRAKAEADFKTAMEALAALKDKHTENLAGLVKEKQTEALAADDFEQAALLSVAATAAATVGVAATCAALSAHILCVERGCGSAKALQRRLARDPTWLVSVVGIDVDDAAEIKEALEREMGGAGATVAGKDVVFGAAVDKETEVELEEAKQTLPKAAAEQESETRNAEQTAFDRPRPSARPLPSLTPPQQQSRKMTRPPQAAAFKSPKQQPTSAAIDEDQAARTALLKRRSEEADAERRKLREMLK